MSQHYQGKTGDTRIFKQSGSQHNIYLKAAYQLNGQLRITTQNYQTSLYMNMKLHLFSNKIIFFDVFSTVHHSIELFH